MNLLQLCNRLIVEGGISQQPMVTTANMSGELGRVVSWIQSAWMDIQLEHSDWLWMRKSMSFPTIAGQGIYQVGSGLDIDLADFGTWCPQAFRNYPTAVGVIGEIIMGDPIDYDEWRDNYYYGGLRLTQARPTVVAIAPNKALCLGPVAADGYTITGDYFAAPSEMADDAASPGMPSRFHMLIVYRAMLLYGGYEAAGEVYQRAEREATRMMAALVSDQLPLLSSSGALA